MKRVLLLLALLACLLAVPASAQFYIRDGGLSTSWSCSLAGLVASLTECKAAVTGRTYYITDIVVGTTTATSGDYSIQSGTSTNCGSNTTALFPVNSTAALFKAPIAANPSTMVSLTTPIVATVSHAICVIGTGTNTINIQISGFYR